MTHNAKNRSFPVSAICAAILLATNVAWADRDRSEAEHENESKAPFAVGLWGDMPYAKAGDAPDKIAALIDNMNGEKLAFTIFGGDTKDGSSVCSDQTIGADAAARLNSVKAPTVYVLGDNEWTDCHRTNNGGYNALERLSYLRQNMFATNKSFGEHKMTVQQQGAPGAAYSENTRWIHNNVVFVGLNVPGSNNNKVGATDCLSSKSKRVQADCDADNLEYADRNTHNLVWLQEAFDIAKQQHAPGVMIVIQADPGFDWPETETIDERSLPGFDGYTDLLNALVAHTSAYDGQVVLVHGDTHFFKIDKPLLDPIHVLKNFTRLENFGSPSVHWVKATIDPKSANVFHFDTMMVPAN